MKIAENILKENNNLSLDIGEYQKILLKLIEKVQEIAEKVQYNTKKMIVDKEFLTQEDVAEMVYTLSQIQ